MSFPSILFARRNQKIRAKASTSRIVEPDQLGIRLLGLVKRFNNFLPRHSQNLLPAFFLRNPFSLCASSASSFPNSIWERTCPGNSIASKPL